MSGRGLIAVALIGCLTGCSSLTVQVDIADSKAIHVWNSERLLADGLPRVEAEQIGVIEARMRATQLAKLHEYLEAHSAEFDGLSDRERDDIVSDLKRTFNETVGEFYVYHERVLAKLGEQIRDESKKIAECEDKFRNYEAELARRRNRAERRRAAKAARAAAKAQKNTATAEQTQPAASPQRQQVNPSNQGKRYDQPAQGKPQKPHQPTQANEQQGKESRRTEPAARNEFAEVDPAELKPLSVPTCNRNRARLITLLRQREQLIGDVERGPDFVLNESAGVLTSLIGQDGLFREPEAFAIANAPDHFWSRNFDRSYSWSLFGDTNVAIKMESRGSFSIKGVSFDPSEVTRVASKVVTQSLLAWTQIAGVPALPQAGRPGSTPVVLAQADQEHLLFETQRNDEWRALLAVADSLAAAEDRLSVESSRKAAIASLVAIWEANRDRIMQREQEPAVKTLTLVPAEARVGPGDKVTLYPAVTVQSGDVNVGVDCASTVADCPFNLPTHVVIPRETGTGQVTLLADPSAQWKAYTVFATLDRNSREATIHIAPEIKFDSVPQTLLAGTIQPVEIDLRVKPPAGTPILVLAAKNLTVEPENPQPNDEGKISVRLTARNEGTGELSVKPGDTPPQTKTITILKPDATAAPVEVAVGEEKDVEVTANVDAALLPQVVLTLEDLPDGLTRVPTSAAARLDVGSNSKATFRIKGVTAGTHNVGVTLRGGDRVLIPVTVKEATRHAIEAKEGENVIEGALDLDLGTPVTLTLSSASLPAETAANVVVDPPGVVTVVETVTIPASGGTVALTITPAAAGTTMITITDANGTLTPLTFEVTVTPEDEEDSEL